MTTGSDPIEAMRAALAKLDQQRLRYAIKLNRTAEVHLRRMSRPHKWRGACRSMRHLRPVRAWLRSVEASINTPEVYAEIDKKVADWIASGHPPWITEADVPPGLRDARFAQRISNL